MADVSSRRAWAVALLVTVLALVQTPALAGRWLPAAAQAPVWAALLAVALGGGRSGLRRLASSALRLPRWDVLLVAVALPLSVGAIAALITAARGGTSPLLPVAAPLTTLVAGPLLAGVIEEPAWRGTLQRALRSRLAAAPAWLATGLVWYAWHRLQSPPGFVGGFGLADLVGALYVVSVGAVYGWLFERAGTALAAPVLAHASMHVAFTVFALGDATDLVVALWVALGVVVTWKAPRVPAGV